MAFSVLSPLTVRVVGPSSMGQTRVGSTPTGLRCRRPRRLRFRGVLITRPLSTQGRRGLIAAIASVRAVPGMRFGIQRRVLGVGAAKVRAATRRVTGGCPRKTSATGGATAQAMTFSQGRSVGSLCLRDWAPLGRRRIAIFVSTTRRPARPTTSGAVPAPTGRVLAARRPLSRVGIGRLRGSMRVAASGGGRPWAPKAPGVRRNRAARIGARARDLTAARRPQARVFLRAPASPAFLSLAGAAMAAEAAVARVGVPTGPRPLAATRSVPTATVCILVLLITSDYCGKPRQSSNAAVAVVIKRTTIRHSVATTPSVSGGVIAAPAATRARLKGPPSRAPTGGAHPATPEAARSAASGTPTPTTAPSGTSALTAPRGRRRVSNCYARGGSESSGAFVV